MSVHFSSGADILTSSLPFRGGGGMVGDQVAPTAMIDRVVHHAALSLKGAGHRLRNRELDTAASVRHEDCGPESQSPVASLSSVGPSPSSSVVDMGCGPPSGHRQRAGRRLAWTRPRTAT